MNMRFALLAAMLAIPATAQTQVMIRRLPPLAPAPGQNPVVPQTPQQLPDAMPEWYKDFQLLNNRIVQLESRLAEANQEVAQLRAEYTTHTHSSCQPALVWGNKDGFAQISVWRYCDRVATGGPIQAKPFLSLVGQ